MIQDIENIQSRWFEHIKVEGTSSKKYVFNIIRRWKQESQNRWDFWLAWGKVIYQTKIGLIVNCGKKGR